MTNANPFKSQFDVLTSFISMRTISEIWIGTKHWAYERPATFERFIAWITKGTLTRDAEDRFNLDLFGLAFRLDAKLLMNDLIEEYRREFLARWTTANDITRLYAHDNVARLQILHAWLWVKVIPEARLEQMFGHNGPDRRFA
jgi:hypothetical protein